MVPLAVLQSFCLSSLPVLNKCLSNTHDIFTRNFRFRFAWEINNYKSFQFSLTTPLLFNVTIFEVKYLTIEVI